MLSAIDISIYKKDIDEAVISFWQNRGAHGVTAGLHMDGFTSLLAKIAEDQSFFLATISTIEPRRPSVAR